MQDRRYRPFCACIIIGFIIMFYLMSRFLDFEGFLKKIIVYNAIDFLIPVNELVVYNDEPLSIIETDKSVIYENLTPMNNDVTQCFSDNVITIQEKNDDNVENQKNEINDGNEKFFNKEELCDFNYLLKNFYIVTSITEFKEEMLKPRQALDKDLSIKKDNTKPQILIFHTHSQEGFVDSNMEDDKTTIVGVGDYLCELLQDRYGYNVYHDRSVYDLVDGKLDRSQAYTYAERSVAKILEQYPEIEVVIDLHRDGVDDSTHLVKEINGKQCANVMLFNGVSYSRLQGEIGYLYNPYREGNLASSLQLYLLGEAYYPGFLRKNYINAYRYCLHYREKSFLIEAGAQTNTFEEEKNAMEPLADILNKMLSGEKPY